MLAAIFQLYTVELDVRYLANDAEIEGMGVEERREVYEKAKKEARKRMRESESVITLQMPKVVGVRFVRRGEGVGRFGGCYA